MTLVTNITAKLTKANLEAITRKALAEDYADFNIASVKFKTEYVWSGYGLNESKEMVFTGADVALVKKPPDMHKLLSEGFRRLPSGEKL